MPLVTIDSDNFTTEDMFEIIATLIARLERAEEVVCGLAGLCMADSGMVTRPSSDVRKEMLAEIADYVVLIDQARRTAAADTAFLNARE